MKPALMLFLFTLTVSAPAQFRGQEPRPPSVSDHQINTSSSLILGFFDPSRLSMSHTVSAGYVSVGGAGLGYSAYTNSLRYQISDPLSVRADVTMMYSPFGSLSGRLQNGFGGVFLERAAVDYRPSKDFGIHLRFDRFPTNAGSWYGGFGADHYGPRLGTRFDPWSEEP